MRICWRHRKSFDPLPKSRFDSNKQSMRNSPYKPLPFVAYPSPSLKGIPDRKKGGFIGLISCYINVTPWKHAVRSNRRSSLLWAPRMTGVALYRAPLEWSGAFRQAIAAYRSRSPATAKLKRLDPRPSRRARVAKPRGHLWTWFGGFCWFIDKISLLISVCLCCSVLGTASQKPNGWLQFVAPKG